MTSCTPTKAEISQFPPLNHIRPPNIPLSAPTSKQIGEQTLGILWCLKQQKAPVSPLGDQVSTLAKHDKCRRPLPHLPSSPAAIVFRPAFCIISVGFSRRLLLSSPPISLFYRRLKVPAFAARCRRHPANGSSAWGSVSLQELTL